MKTVKELDRMELFSGIALGALIIATGNRELEEHDDLNVMHRLADLAHYYAMELDGIFSHLEDCDAEDAAEEAAAALEEKTQECVKILNE